MNENNNPEKSCFYLIANGENHNGEYFAIPNFPCKLGRNPSNDITLKDRHISGNHCSIFRENHQIFVHDLDSKNGTFVNGEKIIIPTSIVPLKSTIMIGKTKLLLEKAEKPIDPDSSMPPENSRTMAVENIISNKSILVSDENSFECEGIEEFLFVVDVCGSTAYANDYGEKALLNFIVILYKTITHLESKCNVRFMKSTGDGFFGTFNNAENALYLACSLLRDKKKIDLLEAHPGIRIALHQGPVSISDNGERLGLACHLVFRLECAKMSDLIDSPFGSDELPLKDRILISGPFYETLGTNFKKFFINAGNFIFKGFNDPIAVYLLQAEANTVLDELNQIMNQ